MVYIDLNMVRAGVVKHPAEWPMCGYHEIQNPPARYAVIDQTALLDLFGFRDLGQLQQACREWIDGALVSKQQARDSAWTESLALGRPEFIEAFKQGLDIRGAYRELAETENAHVLREPPLTYRTHFVGEMGSLRGNNTVLLG